MNIDFEKEFGNNLRKIRENKKMTQEMLATKMQLRGCDITRSAVAKIEVAQRHIYPDEILLIKEILNVSFDDLFYKNEQ
ncbi:MAG: helix-turn-helix transcriptional regulator [Clostridia bacterium]|nr:helix-turn-helix transcriptional regulator [Clostridia bacterium]